MRIIHSLSDLKDGEIVKVVPATSDKQGAPGGNAIIYAMSIKEYGKKFPTDKTIVIPQVSTPAPIDKSIAMLYTSPSELLEKFKGILKVKLMSGKTIEQTLKDVSDYTSTIHGEDFAMWYKLFNFINAIKAKDDSEPSLIGNENGILVSSFKRDANLYQHFTKPYGIQKGKPYYTTKQKAQIDKWLIENQKPVEFPSAILNKYTGEESICLTSEFIYRIAEIVSKGGRKSYVIQVNTHVLDTTFHNYITVPRDDIDTSYHKWDEITKDDPDIKKYRLGGFSDIPLRMILLIKSIYYRSDTTIYKKDGTPKFKASTQHLTASTLLQKLGDLKERLEKHLKKQTKGGNVSTLALKLLDISFTIAKDMEYLFSIPILSDDSQYHFNINAGTFDRQYMAKRLSDTTK